MLYQPDLAAVAASSNPTNWQEQHAWPAPIGTGPWTSFGRTLRLTQYRYHAGPATTPAVEGRVIMGRCDALQLRVPLTDPLAGTEWTERREQGGPPLAVTYAVV
jgi:hypothetical protein